VARKTINAGAMRHRVSFYRDSGSGTPGVPVYDTGNIADNPWYWCSYRTLSGELKYTAQMVWQQTKGEIIMRYTKVPFGDQTGYTLREVEAGWFALIDGKEWNRIELVINEDERNEVYTLTVVYFGPYEPGSGDPPPPDP